MSKTPAYHWQRAWLLKLLAMELHAGDMCSSSHRDACQSILSHLFGGETFEIGSDNLISHSLFQKSVEHAGTRTISKNKVLVDTFSQYSAANA